MADRADRRSAEGVNLCQFERGPSLYVGYDVITIRAPTVGDDRRTVALRGPEAQAKIVKYHLASTVGILLAAGFTDAAHRVTVAAGVIIGALEEESDAGTTADSN